ncbi:MAG: hypothetical protein L6V93_14335 [Clostridiales bacterium]|nr:MAG: hypothetical protein L6V93_14335 [Clostridiales bacterium]
MAMIMRRLEAAGFDPETTALALYGSYTGYAVPLFNMPPTLIFVNQHKRCAGNRRRICQKGTRLCFRPYKKIG